MDVVAGLVKSLFGFYQRNATIYSLLETLKYAHNLSINVFVYHG